MFIMRGKLKLQPRAEQPLNPLQYGRQKSVSGDENMENVYYDYFAGFLLMKEMGHF
jgi:hypothetical protein